MSAFDVEKLLQPVSEDSPCGENLEYDPEYLELQSLLSDGGAQQMIVSDDDEAGGEPRKWGEMKRVAVALTERTKDVWVGVALMRAAAQTDGYPGFASGAALIRGLVEKYWDGLYPPLDPEDPKPAEARVNILSELASLNTTVRELREVPIVTSPMGKYTLRDVKIVSGELKPTQAQGDDAPAPDGAGLNAAFMSAELDELSATAEALDQAMVDIDTIDSLVQDQVGVTEGPDLGPLSVELKSARAVLTENLKARGVAQPGAEDAADGGAAAPGQAAMQLTGDISSRDDVVRILDKICEYFRRNEPSSPVPLLLQRAKRLVAKDFMDILKDLTPEAVAKMETIGGKQDKD